MKTFVTHLGTLYSEEVEFNKNDLSLREEEDRLKIFDSDGNYLDYFSMERLQEMADENETDLETVLEMIIDQLAESVDIEEFLDNLGIDYEFVSEDIDEFIRYANSVGIENIKNNEWINHIGNAWILLSER